MPRHVFRAGGKPLGSRSLYPRVPCRAAPDYRESEHLFKGSISDVIWAQEAAFSHSLRLT
jgi:hypothetical protein